MKELKRRAKEKLDVTKKALHNLVSLPLTNKTIRGDALKSVAGKVL